MYEVFKNTCNKQVSKNDTLEATIMPMLYQWLELIAIV